MPTYDYRCERTGEMFEQWQSFADDALTECPRVHDGESSTCGASVKKVFSKVGISFKGEGFYKNDHGSTSKKSAADSGSSDSSGSGSDNTTSKPKDTVKSDSTSTSGKSSSSSGD